MESLTIKKIIEICNGELISGNENIICSSFNKDTRVINAGDVYIGIKGSNFDGNKLYLEAFSKGAIACILERSSYDLKYDGDKAIVLVDDMIEALRLLGIYMRENSNALFVGVTGSVGKTSTRDLIYSVVSESFKSLKTEGNYNNNIGLPLTLLRLNDEKAAVIEMGMNRLGEIDYLSKITRPNIAVITNVGTAHIGELGSRENILKAKLEILNGLEKDGKLIINNDNDLLHDYYLAHPENVISIGINTKSDFIAKDIMIKDFKLHFNIVYNDQVYPVVCPVPSKVFVYNSLIAFAVGILVKMDVDSIIRGIESFKLTEKRTEIFKRSDNITVINDSYNASVDSMLAGLETLKSIASKRSIAVLGSMMELGEYSYQLHRKVGEEVYKQKIDILITVGEDAKYIAEAAIDCGQEEKSVYSFSNNKEAIAAIDGMLKQNDTLLIKASNSMHFNEIADFLRD